MPDEIQYLLDWFWDIDRCRTAGFSGPNPLTLNEMEAWSRMTGNFVRREEFEVLRGMDGAFLKAYSAVKNGIISQVQSDPSPMTADRFDAMFGIG